MSLSWREHPKRDDDHADGSATNVQMLELELLKERVRRKRLESALEGRMFSEFDIVPVHGAQPPPEAAVKEMATRLNAVSTSAYASVPKLKGELCLGLRALVGSDAGPMIVARSLELAQEVLASVSSVLPYCKLGRRQRVGEDTIIAGHEAAAFRSASALALCCNDRGEAKAIEQAASKVRHLLPGVLFIDSPLSSTKVLLMLFLVPCGMALSTWTATAERCCISRRT
jgi:hypothetical protein